MASASGSAGTETEPPNHASLQPEVATHLPEISIQNIPAQSIHFRLNADIFREEEE